MIIIWRMEITYQGQSVYFGQEGARLTILLNGKSYRARWGRSWQEKGNLPHVASLSDELLNAGLLEAFKTQRVPILADRYSTTNGDGFSADEKLKPREYICGVLVKYLQEKRVYVVTGTAEVRLVPKISRLTKVEFEQIINSSD